MLHERSLQICFGLDHPYYLQTLALWTFLKEKRDKSDAELLSLMNFHYNKPVDVGGILAQRNLVLPQLPKLVQQYNQADGKALSERDGHDYQNLEED